MAIVGDLEGLYPVLDIIDKDADSLSPELYEAYRLGSLITETYANLDSYTEDSSSSEELPDKIIRKFKQQIDEIKDIAKRLGIRTR